MGRRRRDRKVQLARRALLTILVIFLGVLSAVYYARIKDRPLTINGESTDGDSALSDLLSAGEGFEYEATEGDQRLFRIRAERVVQSRDSLFELEKAFIEVTRDDGKVYEIEADTALYQAEERMTELEGNAIVRSDSGAEVASSGFELLNKGRKVTSTGPVRFRFGDRFQGRANDLEVYLRKNRYQLQGRVRVNGGPEDPSFSLSCRRLIYEEETRRIYAEGDVRLLRRGQEINAGRVTVTLAEDSDDIRFVRARFNVSGSQAQDDDLGSRMEFEGGDLSLAYDEITGLLRQGELAPQQDGAVWVEATDESQVAQRLTATRLVLGFQGEALERVEAFGKVFIKEYLKFAPETILLLTCSNSAVADFSEERGVERLRLINRVDLHQEDVHAVGQSVVRVSADGATTIEGFPASVVSVRGELQAPAIVFYDNGGRAEASGGVRAIMARSSGFSMIRDQTAQSPPVNVTSDDASWDSDSATFSFSGGARAWQGEDFIVADRIGGASGGARLEASGKVRTVIKSRRSQEEDATVEERSPIEVAAGEMEYLRESRLVRYRDSPVARQAGRTVRCEELELELDEAEELERMICRGNVEIDDPAEDRSIEGDLAIYRPGASLLEVGGQPAILNDTDGGEVRGSVLIYDLETGVANVRTGTLDEGASRE